MIKIGEFSKLAHVTVKTLHHYDELGLLKPLHIDRFNGYRYYTLAQLSQLNRILALKDLGFSLEQVSDLLKEDLSVAEIRGMLRMKQAELTRKVELEGARLSQVEHRLQQIEQEGMPPGQEIAIKEIGPQVVLSTRGAAASKTAILPTWERLQTLLLHSMEQARLKPTGPWFTLMDEFDYTDSDLEIEMAVPVKPGTSQRAGDWEGTPVRLRQLAAVREMACVVHEDGYPTINHAYTHLYTWLQANAFRIAGPAREIHLQETGFNTPQVPGTDPGYIEVQSPVERVPIPSSILLTKTNQKEKIMKPKFVSKSAMTVVGMAYIGKNENQEAEFNPEISEMWQRYMTREKEIGNLTGKCDYGVCFSNPEGAAEGEFEYLACIEVTEVGHVPEGMVVRQVPAYRYAAFTHTGPIKNLGETYRYIYETWLPQSGEELHPDRFDMELYDSRMSSDAPEFDILVALK